MNRPSAPSLLCALGAAALGWTLQTGFANLAPELSASRWRALDTAVPLVGSAVPGQLRPSARALDLAVGSGASPLLPDTEAFDLEFDARVPEGGVLLLRWGDDIDRLLPKRPSGAGLAPTRTMVDIEAMAGVLVSVDRSPRSRISVRGLGGCTSVPAPGEDFHLALHLGRSDFSLAIDGQTVMQCNRPMTEPVRDLVLASGVRRVQLDNVAIKAGDFALYDGFGGPLRHPLVGLLLAAVAGVLGYRGAGRGLALALSPALAGPVLTLVGTRGALDGWRLVSMPEGAGPLLFSALPAALLCLVPLSARLGFLASLSLGVTVGCAFVGAAALGGANPAHWLMLSSIAPILAVMAWINTHPFRARPFVSLALSVAVAVLGEVGLRWADRNNRWTVTAGWMRSTEEFQELVEIRRYRSYPDKGFPVQPPEPNPARRRIVAFGGSSTGGAFNFDNLDMFWPARLGAKLRDTDWEVVNQGVGGWNTLHIRLYLESQVERLAPDIVVLYVGHNDLGEAPMPYSTLYRNWRDGGEVRAGAARERLGQLRLYNGLRFGLLALLRHGGAVAVPLGDARDNLSAIAEVAAANGAKLLLLTEGLNPDPTPMEGYYRVEQEVAAEHGGRAANAAAAIYATGNLDFFLDDCHLTVMGHEFLAGYVKEQLQGWL